jgi:Ca-activated chloride channel family protein
MNDETEQPDWHDQLLDRALAEVVGGETPPDLSERILAAAEAFPVTLAQGAAEMDTTTTKRRNLKPWFALAASLAAVGLTIGLTVYQVRQVDDRRSSVAQVDQKALGLQGQINDAYAGKPAEARNSEGLKMMVTPQVTEEESDAPATTMPSPYYLSDGVEFYAGGKMIQSRPRLAGGPPMDRWGIFSKREWLRREDESLRRQLGETELGTGPGTSGDQYTRIYENPFIVAQGENAVSTFSIDVDTASYANVRQFLEQMHCLPPPDAVRIEELVNYFDYDYAGPTDDRPFAAHLEVAGCPWNSEHRLVRIALKGREIDRKARPQSNLVFLIDVSGSMDEPNKLPLLIEGMKLLTRELGENDKVAIVVYASSEGLALASTRGDQQQTILGALDQLRAGGSTAGGAGIQLAYQTAVENFIQGGVNRVILCTDGDFNVGVTSTAELERLAEEKAKDTGVFLTVLGFGRGNLNDAMMEAISGKGNGNYHYVDNLTEARKVLVEEMTGTLITIAKDVKIQVEFNPAKVAGYRLLGYENRMLRTEDFNDDRKDAGEIGAGHTVTALYEVVPVGQEVNTAATDPLKYQGDAKPQAASGEMLTLKLRYKEPDGDTSTKIEFPLTDNGKPFVDASEDFQFASAVASFGMLLRNSDHKGNSTLDNVLEIAQGASHHDPHGYRAEFLELARLAKQLAGGQPLSTEGPSSTDDTSRTEGP